MRYWDSSALVPLLIPETQTHLCRRLLEQDPDMLVWMFSPTEILSAIHRKSRLEGLTPAILNAAKRNLLDLQEGWFEIIQWETVREKANRLLAVHSLRAADALQLAAALVAFEDKSSGEEFVTFDQALAEAASREGFKVLEGD